MNAPIGRVPPHDLDAEAAVLSAIVSHDPHGERWDEVSGVISDGAVFHSPANRRIWEAAGALRAEGKPVDSLTVASWLKARERLAEIGGTAYLSKITDAAPDVWNAFAYAETVVLRAIQRQTIAAAQAIAAEGYGDVGDVKDWHAKSVAQLEKVASLTVEQASYLPIGEVAKRAFRKMEQNARDGVSGKRIPTGIAAIDDVVMMAEGDLVVVGARPGQGKSAFAEGVAVHAGEFDLWTPEHRGAWRDEVPEALVFSLEMPSEQLALRSMCAKGKVNLSALRRGSMTQEDWDRLTHAAQDIQTARTFIDDRSGLTIPQIRQTIRRKAKEARNTWYESGARGRLGLVVIDYLQLLRVRAEKGVSRSEAVGEATRELKNIAKGEGLVVMLLSQLNRAVEQRPNKRPLLSDLRDSGEIEQDADIVLMLYRDEYYNRDSRLKGIAEVLAEKQRNGEPAKRIFCRWQGAYTLLSELTPSEREQLEREAEEETQKPARRARGSLL